MRPRGVGYGDLIDEAGVVRGHDEVAALAPEVPDDHCAGAFQNLDHAADPLPGAPAGDPVVDANDDGIAREGYSSVVRRDLNGRLISFSINDNERGSAGSELDYAFD
jgi:hypothetical protein